MISLSPKIAQLLNLGEEVLDRRPVEEAFVEALDAAEEFNNLEETRFEFFMQGRKRIPVVENLALDVRGAFQKRREALNKIREYLKGASEEILCEGLREVEESSIVIAQTSRALGSEDYKIRFSISPLLNDFIQAGLNVYGGHEPPTILGTRMPLVITYVSTHEQEFRNHLEIHPEIEEIAPLFSTCISSLKEGVGAVQIFLDEGDPKNLLAGLHLIIENSRALFELTGKINEKTAGRYTYSFLPDIERLYVRKKKLEAGEIPREIYLEAVSRIEHLIQIHREDLDALREAPIAAECKEEFVPRLEEILASEKEALAALSEDETNVEPIKSACENFSTTYRDAVKRAQGEWADLSCASNFEQLREIIIGVYEDTIPKKFLRLMGQYLYDQLSLLLARETDPEVLEALQLQREGFVDISNYFLQDDKNLLAESLKKLQAGALKLVELEKRQAEARASREAPQISCVKCGTPNPQGTSHCTKCGAYIPFAKDMILEEASLSIREGQPVRTETYQNVQILEDLVESIQNGTAGVKEMKKVVEPLFEEASKVLVIAQKTPPPTTTEKEKKDFASFIDSTRIFVAGLQEMQFYEKDGDTSHLLKGLEMVREASQRFRALEEVAQSQT